VRRLALLYALLDNESQVMAEHLHAARALWDYCAASVAFLFGNSLGDPTADTTLAALKEAPQGLARSQIGRELFQRHTPAAEIDQALALLAAHALAHSVTTPTGGRPEQRWFAGPKPATKATKAT
jgi:hypothetical protein